MAGTPVPKAPKASKPETNEEIVAADAEEVKEVSLVDDVDQYQADPQEEPEAESEGYVHEPEVSYISHPED